MSDKPPPAANPAPAAEGADPSMEEILASIRRILNEDDPSASPAPAGDAPPPDDDVLVLDDSMMVPAAGHAADDASVEEHDGVAHAEAEPDLPVRLATPVAEAATQEHFAAEPHQPEMEAPTSSTLVETRDEFVPNPDLIAPEAAAAAAMSVNSLVRTLAAGRGTQVYAGGPTLEDMVRAELRPLLKAWLDTNLPPMVERLVRAEIERVVGRAVP